MARFPSPPPATMFPAAARRTKQSPVVIYCLHRARRLSAAVPPATKNLRPVPEKLSLAAARAKSLQVPRRLNRPVQQKQKFLLVLRKQRNRPAAV